MERQIEREDLKDQIELFRYNIHKKLKDFKADVTKINKFINNNYDIFINKLNNINNKETNNKYLEDISKNSSLFELEVSDNSLIIDEKLNDITAIIELLFLYPDLIIDRKYLEQIETYYSSLIKIIKESSEQILNEAVLISYIESNKIDTYIINLNHYRKNFKEINSVFKKTLYSLHKSLKLAFSQYQLSINESFKLASEKEIQKSNKNFNQERQKILNDYKNEINYLKERYNEDSSNLNQIIKSSKSEISNLKIGFEQIKYNNFELTKKINEYANEVNNLVGNQADELKINLDKHIESLRLDFEKKISDINDSYETAKKNYQNFSALAERAGVYGLTQNYAKKAKEEKIEYQNYRKYTTYSILAAIGTTVSVILIPIFEHWGTPINMDGNYYFTLMARLTISVMFFILALYLSKQASKHYESYQENHRTYLQLAALEPFINRMTDDEQLNIRKSLIPIYFNQNKDGKFASKEDEVKYNIFSSHLKNLKQMVKK